MARAGCLHGPVATLTLQCHFSRQVSQTFSEVVWVLCDDAPAAPDKTPVVGVIKITDLPVEITVPDTVNAGSPFRVTVQTWKREGCTRKGDTEVTVDGRGEDGTRLVPITVEREVVIR